MSINTNMDANTKQAADQEFDSSQDESSEEEQDDKIQQIIQQTMDKQKKDNIEKQLKLKEENDKKNAEAADGKPKKKSLNIKAKTFTPQEKKPELSEEDQFYFDLQENLSSQGYDIPFIQNYIMQLKNQNQQDQSQGFDFNKFVTKKKAKKEATTTDVPKEKKAKKEVKPQVIEIKQQKIVAEELCKMNFDRTKYDAVDEIRVPLNIVFIGHVDAGKSTICGQVLLLSNQVDLNELKRYELEAKEKNRESWYLAYIMDQGEEERAKGKTVEVGKAHFETKTKRFTIIDAPGHKNYVPNMIAGTSQADVGALVISAKMGEFESGFEKGGQTREHALLAKSIGIRHLIVLINKMDDIQWDRERYLNIISTLKSFLLEVGYDVERHVSWVPIAGLHGDNMLHPSKDKNAEWYKGDTFFTILDELSIQKRDPDGPLRIPVLDKIRDQGLFLTGKIEQGSIRVDYIVQLMPSRKQCTIQQIMNSKDQSVYYAKPGENVKIKVKGLEDEDVARGQILCSLGESCHVTQEIEAELSILTLPEHKSILTTGYQCILHLHCAIEEVSISSIVCSLENGKKNTNTTFLRPNMTAIVRIYSEKYLCCEKYEENVNLGSFTLRDEGLTIALGKVLRIKPVKTSQVQIVQQQTEVQQKIEVKAPVEEPDDCPF